MMAWAKTWEKIDNNIGNYIFTFYAPSSAYLIIYLHLNRLLLTCTMYMAIPFVIYL